MGKAIITNAGKLKCRAVIHTPAVENMGYHLATRTSTKLLLNVLKQYI
uniref:Macro domain-containing protein n=1 Tax=Ignisphaera aggregans TaxID=334771 RepID=A0A7C4JKA2_9CREN